MSLSLWIAAFAIVSLFWTWLLFWDGAEWIEGTLLSGLLLWWHAPSWSATGIRIFAAGTWVFQTIWFIFGLFEPSARPFFVP